MKHSTFSATYGSCEFHRKNCFCERHGSRPDCTEQTVLAGIDTLSVYSSPVYWLYIFLRGQVHTFGPKRVFSFVNGVNDGQSCRPRSYTQKVQLVCAINRMQGRSSNGK